MRLTFFTETGQSYVVEVDPQMQLGDIMALLEAEVVFGTKEDRYSLTKYSFDCITGSLE